LNGNAARHRHGAGDAARPVYTYQRTSLIPTTNLPFESRAEVLGSQRPTGAAPDRLTHRCQILEATTTALCGRHLVGDDPIWDELR
ncbi:unnamed protein product, partial [marine sediment metagenome]